MARLGGASKRTTSAQTAAAYLEMRAKATSDARQVGVTSDYCARCGKERRAHERGWRWIYPDRAAPYSLAPLAVVCPTCPCDDPPLTDREVR